MVRCDPNSCFNSINSLSRLPTMTKILRKHIRGRYDFDPVFINRLRKIISRGKFIRSQYI